ncbi:equilibrative nucleoside transporter 1-like isoform X2 [Pomacea canaliculata]|uniref:equilibrative nucleoside transporter 1-like isoform X2 n=1 Tax=Pomacea canaliculata TaxID=400727 RepID=UPI000D72F7A9|nr:equilibrative nucleoside transporter 1-like isoform X2 [Pomacea canaliculata]
MSTVCRVCDLPFEVTTTESIQFDSEERERFLSPVKLDPGWEGMDRPVDELNFRRHDPLDELERTTPRDRWNLVYVILLIHGIGVLMPWNMFITAKSYFEDYKLTNGTQTSPEVGEYRKNFMSYLGMASQFPNALMSVLNVFVQCGGKPGTRIIGSILVMVLVFVLTVVLAMLDSSSWQEIFFWITMGSAVVLNSAGGVYQNTIYGVSAILPMKYTNAVIFGTNFSGTLVACISILAIALAPDIKTSAIYYFVTAIVILLIAFDTYFILPLTKFYRHYKKIELLKRQRSHKHASKQTCAAQLRNYWKIFKNIWVMALSIWFTFFVTLALFPQIQSDIEQISFPIDETYWTPVFCYLSFSFFAMSGNLLTEWIRVPGPRFVWLPVLLRAAFIPIFLLCNFRPEERGWPVLISNDIAYIVASILMAFTSGYFSSLCMMYGPKNVEGQDAGAAGMMMALFLALGIVCGINMSRLLVWLVDIKF